jgi:hypothetical protein
MYKNNVISTKNERLTSDFGMRRNPTGGGMEMHNGADFTDAHRLERTQDVGIIAIEKGVIIENHWHDLSGWVVTIQHEGRIISRYGHLKNRSSVKIGDKVEKGANLGIMGTTGRSTGIHLHFAVKENSTAWNNGIFVDPVPYMKGVKFIGGSPAVTKQTSAENTEPGSSQAAFIKAGDKVRLKQGAATFTGRAIAAFVFNEIWIVLQVTGSRAVIDENISGTNRIMTPVNVNDLIKI